MLPAKVVNMNSDPEIRQYLLLVLLINPIISSYLVDNPLCHF